MDLATSDLSIDLSCASTPLPECVPGQYELTYVTDPVLGGCPDPRCGPVPPEVGADCIFPGLACQFASITIVCDCNHVAHCADGPEYPYSYCPNDAGTK